MRSRVALGLVLTVVGLAGPAAADRFGGFVRDGRYVVGPKLCTPRRAAPTCAAVDSRTLAGLELDAGTLERGATARIKATAAGTTLRISGKDGALLAQWDAGDPIAAIAAVHLARDGKHVAVELTVRSGGRTREEVVVVAVSLAAASSTPPGPTPAPAPTPAPGTTLAPKPTPMPALAPAPTPPRTPEQAAAHARAIKEVEGHLAKRRWAKAEAAARAALTPSYLPELVVLLAGALARQGRAADAVGELAVMAASRRADLAIAQLDARESSHLASLRADPGFRKAVGLEPDPDNPPGATMRLLGGGGRWEQPSVPCKQPEVGLALDRTKLAFKLEIHLRCQGEDEVTRLRGRFEIAEPTTLRLVFPNAGAADERLECTLAPCDGEDCLACALDELSFTLRVVRR